MGIGNIRAGFLNYKKPGIFFITMNKSEEIPYFSRIIHNPYESKLDKAYRPNYENLGYIIFNAIRNIGEINPSIKIHQYVIMPDHIHLILEIKEELDLFLWEYIEEFKNKIFREASNKNLIPSHTGTVFETGFNDLFLKYSIKLDIFFQYIRLNPYRFWVKWKFPQYFRRVHDKLILGYKCSLYGNLFLLDHPYCYPVVVHRKDKNDGTFLKKIEFWRYVIKNGGVLIGAFIAEEEKKILDEAINNNGKIIKLLNRQIGDKETPKGEIFETAKKGNILFVSPDMTQEVGKIREFRQECLFMNAFAENFCRTGLATQDKN